MSHSLADADTPQPGELHVPKPLGGNPALPYHAPGQPRTESWAWPTLPDREPPEAARDEQRQRAQYAGRSPAHRSLDDPHLPRWWSLAHGAQSGGWRASLGEHPPLRRQHHAHGRQGQALRGQRLRQYPVADRRRSEGCDLGAGERGQPAQADHAGHPAPSVR